MSDREKVIRGLRCHARWEQGYGCKKCDYSESGGGCSELLAMDALALLQEQEAENGEWITIWREDDPDTSTHARCSICNRISERPLGGYCKWCGAKMSQEWGVDG